MAKVAVVVRVLPEDVSINMEQLVENIKQKLPEQYSLKAWDEEPIAFGLKALRILVTMPEETEGGTEPLEELINSIPGVSQVEVLMVHRVLE
ncbi:MAG: elongation factor 1-beta [Desulfurococcaceae archaeon]